MKRRIIRVARALPFALVGLIVVAFLAVAAVYTMLNSFGPSTEYYQPKIDGALLLPNGKYLAYLGDRIFVTYIVVRHSLNGSCFMTIERMGDNVGGPAPGKKHLLDYADLQFVGQNELRRPRWPIPGLILGYDVDHHNRIIKSKPLLEPGTSEQELRLYVHARYYCNIMDYIIPRYLQGGDIPDETASVNLIVRRERP